jgi:hypothetical protein
VGALLSRTVRVAGHAGGVCAILAKLVEQAGGEVAGRVDGTANTVRTRLGLIHVVWHLRIWPPALLELSPVSPINRCRAIIAGKSVQISAFSDTGTEMSQK